MRGHEALIALRLSRRRPRAVFIDVMAATDECWRDWQQLTPQHAHVDVSPDEPIHRLDFRFTVGMNVIVTGDEQSRAQAISDACIEAGALRVVAAAVVVDTVLGERVGRVLWSGDTAQ